MSDVFLCESCSDIVHKNRHDHKDKVIEVKQPMGDLSMFSKMQLLSVVCIETSHYVCFTRTNKDKWLFHDSMANRLCKLNHNNVILENISHSLLSLSSDDMYNIPRVTDVSEELNYWVYNPANHQKLLQASPREIPECVRRFTQDIYMCVYINPDLDRYGDYFEDSANSISPTFVGEHLSRCTDDLMTHGTDIINDTNSIIIVHAFL